MSYYYARSDLKTFWKHNVRNGAWAILPFLYSNVTPVSPRHLVPLMFVLAVGISLLLSPFVTGIAPLAGAIVGTYVLANVASASQVAWNKKDIRYLFLMPIVFSMLHLAYGLGSLQGFAKLVGTHRAAGTISVEHQ